MSDEPAAEAKPETSRVTATATITDNVLSPAEIQELQEIFSLVDLDGGGTISKDELASLMQNLGLEASKAEMENIFNEIDSKGTGEVDFENFVAALSKKVEFSIPPGKLMWAFHKFEKPGAPLGQIFVKDAIIALTEYGEKGKRMTKEEATALMRLVAPNLDPEDAFDYTSHIEMMFSS